MKRSFVLGFATLPFFAPLLFAEDAADKEIDAQIQAATSAAAKMNVKMPNMKELTDETDKEEAEQKKKEAQQKAAVLAAVNAKGPVALPPWTPPVPQFTPSCPVTRKLVDGEPRIVLAGTSPLPPDALADSWDTFKKPNFSHERTGSEINHSVDLFVSFRNGEDNTEVKMEAERKAGAKITQVTISSPLPMPAAAE